MDPHYDRRSWNSVTINGRTYDLFKSFFAVLVTVYFLRLVRNPADWHFIDNINLIFHEAGHMIFIFFGQFLQIAGGSIFQVLIPAICILYFIKERKYYSASLLGFWLGESFINISVYARDAVVMQLPLLGGDSVLHDWNYLLSNLGMLNSAPLVANILYGLGIMIIISAGVAGVWWSKTRKTL